MRRKSKTLQTKANDIQRNNQQQMRLSTNNVQPNLTRKLDDNHIPNITINDCTEINSQKERIALLPR